MNKKLKIIIISVVFILSIFFIFIRSHNSPERVIKNYIKYEDTLNIDKLKGCRSDYYRLSDEAIEHLKNTESMKLIDIKLLKDESIYNVYMHNGTGALRDNLLRKDIKIYKVKYDIKYKDDNKSPVDSGEYEKNYILVKESDTGEWKIDGIGE